MITTTRPRLDRAELTTTASAVAVSTGLYLRYGHRYLAGGVVGDIAGLALLAAPLIASRRRVRHEAAVCLVGIGLVHATRPDRPTRVREPVLWAAVSLAVGTYTIIRRSRLRR